MLFNVTKINNFKAYSKITGMCLIFIGIFFVFSSFCTTFAPEISTEVVMKKNFKEFIEEFGKSKRLAHDVALDFENVSKLLSQHHINLKVKSLSKLWKYLSSAEKPKKSTLDRLSLFAGFQDWNELQRTFKGE